jgi:hypothetical protein
MQEVRLAQAAFAVEENRVVLRRAVRTGDAQGGGVREPVAVGYDEGIENEGRIESLLGQGRRNVGALPGSSGGGTDTGCAGDSESDLQRLPHDAETVFVIDRSGAADCAMKSVGADR